MYDSSGEKTDYKFIIGIIGILVIGGTIFILDMPYQRKAPIKYILLNELQNLQAEEICRFPEFYLIA